MERKAITFVQYFLKLYMPSTIHKFTLILSFLLSISSQALLYGQDIKFSKEILENPQKQGVKFEKLFNLNEIGTYDTSPQKGKVILENGYSLAKIKNPKDWIGNKKNIVVTQIDVVYTKYPRNKDFWITNYYELLSDRIKALFEIDSSLNSQDFEWNIILQTDCNTEAETKKMFHGICIHYFEVEDFMESEQEEKAVKLPDSLELSKYSLKVQNFIRSQGGIGDSLVYSTFSNHPEWKNALVVMDWTGSMYRYGAQAILWHSLNFQSSGIRDFVFFNDGDEMPDEKKTIGKTGGIYFAQANNMDRLIKTFYLVGKRGKGGDPEENDIEALIKGMNRFEDFDELILIADNQSCMRDFSLISNIGVKVNVIVCGTEYGINPQYINLAYLTGGSIHSIEEEIKHLSTATKEETLALQKLSYELDKENLFRIKNPTQRIRFSPCDDYTTLESKDIDPHLDFIEKHGGIKDSTVFTVLNRHPLWSEAAVVMDWSEPMYTNSAQAILWHKVNPKSSGIDYFAFSNDGNKLQERKKKIGKTGGIYYSKSNNFNQLLKQCELVVKKGDGGDPSSNNLMESLLRSILRFKDAKEFIVIADNESCMRDFKLIKSLKTPVKVILTNVTTAINPQYINLAYQSGGSLHTANDDYYHYVFTSIAESGEKLILNGVSYVLNEEGLFDFEKVELRKKKDCSVSAKGGIL
jgi:hypothetical protein